MPGPYPQVLLNSKPSYSQWPNVQQASTSQESMPMTVDPAMEKLLNWSAGIDNSIVAINQKLEFLLLETKAFRGMEAHYKKLQEQTPMGTNLSNSCQRLDIHQQNILDTVQKLDKTMKQIECLTSDIDRLKEGNEVTVSIKSGRKFVFPATVR
ncbi:hypothetical protein ColTof4_02601 [Colletotrichum tofieldiae]|uniref:Uncharacterized protein n=1 Tax=Colletotrichum tofieldiae TaxID=708197 RepID=A0A161VYW7_9PEZI|nr:hypothetical protein CT0861_06329 [Colletotrichum tofieldiae]GKT70178.1 hypothetical protein ColTof4_02601 [Colletotrichum tofieldiae]